MVLMAESPSTPFAPPQVSNRFFPYSNISTNVILSLDAQSTLSTSEVRAGPRNVQYNVNGALGHFWSLGFPCPELQPLAVVVE